MGTYSYAQVKDIIFKNPNAALVKKAQDMRKLYSRHTHSVGYKDSLTRDTYVEDEACYGSRKLTAISNRDLFKRLLNDEDQVFTTTGGSESFGSDAAGTDQMRAVIDNVTNGINLYRWVHTYALPAYRADPMGLIFMEAEEVQSFDGVTFPTPRCYPTYKSSDEIFDYLPNGRNLEYICFKLSQEQVYAYGLIEAVPNLPLYTANNTGSITGYYRFVDDATDTVYKRDNDNLIEAKMRQRNPIYHGFDKVPAFIISDLFQYDDPKAFGSPLQFVIELAECFFHDRSVRDLHKKLHGFPKAVEPLLACSTCSTGQVSTGLISGKPCPDCTLPGQSQGTGYRLKTTPAMTAKFPLEMLEKVGSFDIRNIFGYITPDTEGLAMMNDGLVSGEDLITCTYWGTMPNNKVQYNGTQDQQKTATETLTNLQPKYSRLNQTADWAENTINNIANYLGKFWFKDGWKDNQANIKLSRDYMLELPQDVIAQYHEMLAKNTPDIELDNQFRRYLQARYKSNPTKLATAIKFYELQPFPHKTDIIVQGSPDICAEDKVANTNFGEWMRTLNELQKQNLKKDVLQKMFQAYCAEKAAKVQEAALEQAAADAAIALTARQNT